MKTFDEATNFVNSKKNWIIDDHEKLMLYALFKIRTSGKLKKKENGLNIVGNMKQDAWYKFSQNYNSEEAEALYIDFVNELIDKYK